MKPFNEQIKAFYVRDLNILAGQIEQMNDEHLWKTMPGITNSCGVLAQHIIGNLNHYIGAKLGGTDYIRNRDREFTQTGISAGKLVEEINETISVIENALNTIDESRMAEPSSLYESEGHTNGEMLIHLYGHFNYHLGQVNYLRRVLAP